MATKSKLKPAAKPKARKANNDRVTKALSGEDVLKNIERLAKKNGLTPDFKRLKRSYKDNHGGIRMAFGNMLRGRLNRGEAVRGL